MSEMSYWQNVDRGVTGPQTATCLLASYDRISEVTGVHPQTYQRYEQLRELYVQTCGDDSNFVTKEVIEQFSDIKIDFRSELGVYTTKNIVGTRVGSVDELSNALGRLAAGGFRSAVYLDTGGLHAVGVVSLGRDYFDVRSTWSPFRDREAVHVEELYSWLDKPVRIRKRQNSGRKTVKQWNIVALPPEGY